MADQLIMKKLWEEAGLLPLWRLNEPVLTDTANVTDVTNTQEDENVASKLIVTNETVDQAVLSVSNSDTKSGSLPETIPELIPQTMLFDTIGQSDSSEPCLTDEPQWERLEAEVVNCRKCDLCLKRTKTVFGVGDRHPEWLFVGEGPGQKKIFEENRLSVRLDGYSILFLPL